MSRRTDTTHLGHSKSASAPRTERSRSANAVCGPQEEGAGRRAILLGGLGIGLLAAGAAAMPYVGPRLYEACCQPVCERKPARIHAILVDRSDEPLPGSQSQGIDALAERFMGESRMGDRTIIAKLLSSATNPTETIKELCDPGRASEKTVWLNTYDPSDTERSASFTDPWRAALQLSKTPSPFVTTPLVEGVKQLSAGLSFYGRDTAVAKRLLIISDVLMNSGPANSYRENLSDQRARAARAYVREFIPTLANCEVTVGLLARHQNRHRQTRQQLAWFEAYLRDGGATAINWVDLR